MSVASLRRCGKPVTSLFGVHGCSENDLSGALGFCLARSHALLNLVLADLAPGARRSELSPEIRIQAARSKQGITDVEVYVPGAAFLVFEAKIHGDLPTDAQLRQYTRRCLEADLPAQIVALVNLNEGRGDPKKTHPSINGVPVQVRSWRWVYRLAARAKANEPDRRGRFALEELLNFLRDFLGQETMYSNEVYVVSLGSGFPDGWKISWIDIVERRARYFYGYQKKQWPVPPNYLGFRYGGKLQCIRHVERYDVVSDLRDHFPEAKGAADWGDHYLIHLGPPIRPGREVKAGPRIHMSARVWCMIDALLTCPTISDALTLTEKRRRAALAVS